jgi:hypothetical protein
MHAPLPCCDARFSPGATCSGSPQPGHHHLGLRSFTACRVQVASLRAPASVAASAWARFDFGSAISTSGPNKQDTRLNGTLVNLKSNVRDGSKCQKSLCANKAQCDFYSRWFGSTTAITLYWVRHLICCLPDACPSHEARRLDPMLASGPGRVQSTAASSPHAPGVVVTHPHPCLAPLKDPAMHVPTPEDSQLVGGSWPARRLACCQPPTCWLVQLWS